MAESSQGGAGRDARSLRVEILTHEVAHRRAVNKIAELQGRRRFRLAEASDVERVRLEEDVARHLQERDRAAARVATLQRELRMATDRADPRLRGGEVATLTNADAAIECRLQAAVVDLVMPSARGPADALPGPRSCADEILQHAPMPSGELTAAAVATIDVLAAHHSLQLELRGQAPAK